MPTPKGIVGHFPSLNMICYDDFAISGLTIHVCQPVNEDSGFAILRSILSTGTSGFGPGTDASCQIRQWGSAHAKQVTDFGSAEGVA
jgi:hypothetical protein